MAVVELSDNTNLVKCQGFPNATVAGDATLPFDASSLTTVNNVLIVFTSWQNPSSQAVFGVTFDGVSLTEYSAAAAASGGSNLIQRVWYLINPPATNANIVANVVTGTTDVCIVAAIFCKVDQTAPITAGRPDSGTGTAPFATLTAPTAPGLMVAVMSAVPLGALTGSVVATGDGGQTEPGTGAGIWNQQAALGLNADQLRIAGAIKDGSAGSRTCSWALSVSSGWIAGSIFLVASTVTGVCEESAGTSTGIINDVLIRIEVDGLSSSGTSVGLLVPEPDPGIEITPASPGGAEYNYGKLVAVKMSWGANEPRVLECQHFIRATDTVNAKHVGDLIVYTDPDLGTVFVGHIFKTKEAVKPGEGWTYLAADLWRFLNKTPAKLSCANTIPAYSNEPFYFGTTHLNMPKDTDIEDGINAVTAAVQQTGWNFITGGIDYSLDPTLLYKEIDMGGMSIAGWIDTMLDQTEDGVAYIKYIQSGDDWLQALRVYNYYDEPDVTIRYGTYGATVLDPNEPMLLEAEIENSADNKYYRVLVEGGGSFRRINGKWIAPTYRTGDPVSINVGNTLYRTIMRFYFDETNVTGWMFDYTGTCVNEVNGSFALTFQAGTLPPVTQNNTVVQAPTLDTEPTNSFYGDSMGPNLNEGKWYLEFIWEQGGTGSGGTGMPSAPVITEQFFNYTIYEGAIQVTSPATPNPALLREGEFVIQRPELYKYYSEGLLNSYGSVVEMAVNTDPTAELQAIADLYQARYSTTVNIAGPLTVFIKGETGDVRPGSRIANFGSGSNVRVRHLEYDFPGRKITLSFSDLPIREYINERKEEKIRQKILHLNWRERKVACAETPCIPLVGFKPCNAVGTSALIADQFGGACGYY